MLKITTSCTIVLLLVAVLVEWLVEQKTQHHIIAEKYIGTCVSVEFSGADAFQSTNKTAIIFKCEGFHGSIKALFIISGDKIEKLQLLKSNEGIDKSVLENRHFLKSFQRNIEDLPMDVDAITGATISSQIVIDEMNRHIKEWNKKNDGY
jgi:Na+-translocating ferredoxin:NAD+ oxidoreductase RnfG subunit